MTEYRKILMPLVGSSAAITAALVIAVLALGGQFQWPQDLGTMLMVFLMVLGFSAAGMFFLLSLAWLLAKRRVPRKAAIATLLLSAAPIGWLLLVWVPENGWIGSLAGVFSAALWCFVNHKQFSSRATI
jgi:hypothetical protein